MKSKIILVILICFMLLPILLSCKKSADKNETDNENIDNLNNTENNQIEKTIKDYASKEVADAVMAVFSPEELPASGLSYFYSGAAENGENYIDPERIGNLINGRPGIVEEFNYLENFALYVPSGQSIFEVSVLKVKKGEDDKIDAVKTVLEKRISRVDKGELMNYAADEVPIFEAMKVIAVNNYVILLSTWDNARAEKVINDMLGGGNNISLANTPADTTAETQTAEITEITAGKKNVSMDNMGDMDEIVDVEPEILFDFNDIPVTEPQTKNDSGLVKTLVPRVDVKQYSQNTMFIIGGKCETGAMIRVTGGTEEIYTGSDYGDYLIEVPFAETGSVTLKMTAEAPGKAPSDEITFILKAQKDVTYYEDSGVFGVVVGYNYMSYFEDCVPDYIGDNLINEKDIESLQKRTEKKISDLRAKGCDAEIVYLLIPNPMRVYPEDVPKRLKFFDGDTLLNQWKKGVTAGGATVIDLTDLMLEHKNDEYKIFHKTDSHWTEYGAYLGYDALMNHFAKKFPDAAPRPSSDFEFYNQEVNFGDIYATIGLSLSDLCETSTFVNFKFDPPHFNPDYNTGHVNIYDENCSMKMSTRIIHARVQFNQTTHTNLTGLNLPSVYVLRDSFEGPLHAFITDRFSTATFKDMWDYDFSATKIANLNPDYVLYVISERNIKNVLYN